jgi:hypothetical protein
MKQIHKFEINVDFLSTPFMDRDAQILHAGEQDDRLYIWALVEPSSPKVRRNIYCVPTGAGVTAEHGMIFINTVQMRNGLVLHLFREQLPDHTAVQSE